MSRILSIQRWMVSYGRRPAASTGDSLIVFACPPFPPHSAPRFFRPAVADRIAASPSGSSLITMTDLELVRDLAERAGTLALAATKTFTREYKADQSLVTNIDRGVEEMIRK